MRVIWHWLRLHGWKILITLLLILAVFLIYVDLTIQKTYQGKKWALPAIVYSRSIELYQGAPVSQKDLIAELVQLGYRQKRRVTSPRQYAVEGSQLVVFLRAFDFPDGAVSSQKIALSFEGELVTHLSTESGDRIVRLEPMQIGGIYPAHNEDRLLVQLAEVPESLSAMLVASEDRDFYQHFGISIQGIVRAALANVKQGQLAQGGSTLTQQLIKNYYLTADRTLSRKAFEIVMAILLELHISKEEILEGYINEVYLGQDGPRGIHGFGLAAQYYFNRPIEELALHQQALLVALVRGASYYNPWRNPERALARRDRMLDAGLAIGALTEDQVTSAKAKPLDIGRKQSARRKRFPAYLDLVRAQLRRDYKDEDLSSSGLRIFTHFDPAAQALAENTMSKGVARLATKYKQPNLEAAAVLSRPDTGAVIAVIGAKNPRYAGFNRALKGRRQIGSLIKPALYLSALDEPQKYTLATLIDDSPVEVLLSDGQIWVPQNYDGKSHDNVMLIDALANSYNQAAVNLSQKIGSQRFIATLRSLGVEGPIPEVPSLSLGVLELSPLEVAQMYQTIAGGGFYTPLMAIQSVLDHQGQELTRYPIAIEQRISTETAYLTQVAMHRVTQTGTAKSLRWRLPKTLAVAGKTGTTDDLRDSWYAGFSGDLQTVVWVGNDDNSPAGVTGSSGALPLWAGITKGLAKVALPNLPPANIIEGWVDPKTQQGTSSSCKGSISLPFVKGSQPKVERRCKGAIIDRLESWLDSWL